MQVSSTASFSPSFSCYASDKVAGAALKVSREVISSVSAGCFDVGEKEVEEFEFPAAETPPFSSGRFLFPIFNGGLVSPSNGVVLQNQNRVGREVSEDGAAAAGILTRNLFIGDRDPLSKSPLSSSDSLELERSSQQARYCLWSPARTTAEQPPGGCRKSKSTGSGRSGRWRFTNLMKRSHSEGKGSFVVVNSDSVNQKNKDDRFKKNSNGSKWKNKASEGEKGLTIHEAFYLRRKKMIKEGDNRRRSYLPYRQDLIGIFAGLNRLGKTFSSSDH